MTAAVGAQSVQKKDLLDLTTSYFTTAKPREFFKSLNQVFFWNKYLTGKETFAIGAGLSIFPKIFDAFNVLDLIDNVNNLRNHLLGKDVKDLSLLVSDTINSACDTVSWFSVSAGIVSLSSLVLDFMMIGSGVTMMYSFARHSITSIKELINTALDKNEKNIKMFEVAKNISLFAIGLLVFISGWFGLPLMIPLVTVFGAVAVISNFAIYMIQNSKKMQVN